MTPATAPLGRLERAGLAALVLFALAFGVLVEIRTAFLSRRMGDVGCYLRGAWAVRAGADMYGIVDDNGWHYNYPPFFAIAMTPLADPPPWPWVEQSGYLPFGVSAAIFIVLNFAFLALAVHTLASALEAAAGLDAQPRYCRRWWALRVWPALACLPPLAHTINRGQVNHLVLALLCGFLACLLRGQRLRAGGLLALAVAIKVVPAYLLIYPLWKRDGRTLLGVVLGLFIALVTVPVMALGPTRAAEQYGRYAEVLFGPLLEVNDDRSRADELLGMNATDSIGLRHALHNAMYFDRRGDRPAEYHPAVVWTNRIAGVLMTLATLWPVGTSRPLREATRFSALLLLMVVFAPVSHLHYLAFGLPLVACLFAERWQQRHDVRLGTGLWLLCGWWLLANALPSLPGLDRLRDLCLPLYGALPLWACGVARLWQREAMPAAESAPRLAA